MLYVNFDCIVFCSGMSGEHRGGTINSMLCYLEKITPRLYLSRKQLVVGRTLPGKRMLLANEMLEKQSKKHRSAR